jgi:hypothetical protein
MANAAPDHAPEIGMADVLQALQSIQNSQSRLAAEVQSVSHRLDAFGAPAQVPGFDGTSGISPGIGEITASTTTPSQSPPPVSSNDQENDGGAATGGAVSSSQKAAFTSRIILTCVFQESSLVAEPDADELRTYPKQNGISPLPLDWGAPSAPQRGPVVVSRAASTIRRRNGELAETRSVLSRMLTMIPFASCRR